MVSDQLGIDTVSQHSDGGEKRLPGTMETQDVCTVDPPLKKGCPSGHMEFPNLPLSFSSCYKA